VQKKKKKREKTTWLKKHKQGKNGLANWTKSKQNKNPNRGLKQSWKKDGENKTIQYESELKAKQKREAKRCYNLPKGTENRIEKQKTRKEKKKERLFLKKGKKVQSQSRGREEKREEERMGGPKKTPINQGKNWKTAKRNEFETRTKKRAKRCG